MPFIDCFDYSLIFLVFGGYGNTKMFIRKRIQSYPLRQIELSSIISELRPMKVLIEVAKGNSNGFE